MMSTPDYEGLVRLLPTLGNLVDACGEVTLTAEEASTIRSPGFPAEAGRWKCPPLPPHLTRDNPLLEPLSAAWDERLLLHEVPNNEAKMAPRTACQQNHETHLPPERSVETIDVPPLHCKAKRREQVSAEEPDLARVEEAASKIEEALKRTGKPIRRRRLQQLLWRYPATVFNAAFDMLRRRSRIFLEIR